MDNTECAVLHHCTKLLIATSAQTIKANRGQQRFLYLTYIDNCDLETTALHARARNKGVDLHMLTKRLEMLFRPMTICVVVIPSTETTPVP